MKTESIATIAVASILLCSCIQNNSYPLRSWIGVGNCTPTLLQREFRVINSKGNLVDNFSIIVGIEPPDGYIPTPFYGDFLDKERTMNGDDYFIVRIINGRVKNIYVPKKHFSNPIRIISSMSDNKTIRITHSTYFPKSIHMILKKDELSSPPRVIMINDMPIGEISTFILD